MGIKAAGISKQFDTNQPAVLRDIHLEIEDGDFVAILGKSGSGKSTLLYILSTLETPSAGSIEIDGLDVAKLKHRDIDKLRNGKIGFVFQFHYLLPELSALENVLMPARARSRDLTKSKERARELLGLVDLQDKEHRKPRQLSGGEQQRVAIARALVMNPKYIFADEPTGALDSASGENIIRLLSSINRDFNTTILMVTHDSDFAARAKRSLHMKDGRIFASES